MQTEFQSFFVFDVSIHSNVETLNSTSEAEISFARLDKPDNKKHIVEMLIFNGYGSKWRSISMMEQQHAVGNGMRLR